MSQDTTPKRSPLEKAAEEWLTKHGECNAINYDLDLPLVKEAFWGAARYIFNEAAYAAQSPTSCRGPGHVVSMKNLHGVCCLAERKKE